MKKLVSAIACFSICFSIHAQTQSNKTQTAPQNGKVQVEKSSEAKTVPTHQCTEHKAVERSATEAPKAQTACPHAATCPKAQAACNQGDAKPPCCAKHQESQSNGGAKTDPKAGSVPQNADPKAKGNQGSDNKSSSPQKK